MRKQFLSAIDLFNDLIKKTFEIEQINDDLSPDSVESWDSITHMDLCAKFEETFDISLDVEDIAEMETIGQIKEILRKYNVDL